MAISSLASSVRTESQTFTRVAEQRRVPSAERSPLFKYSRIALAVTGFMMAAFVIVHMLGNLLAFAGSGAFNAYARSVRDVAAPVVGEEIVLWAARVVLTLTLIVHLAAHGYLVTTIPVSRWFPLLLEPVNSLWESTSNNPRRDQPPAPWNAKLPLLWLELTGGLIVVFVAVHLAQLTIGSAYPGFVPGDAYDNLVGALRYWPVSILYIASAVAVGAHLLPGIWTGMRSLGLIRPATEALARMVSILIPLVLVLGMSAVPVAVLVGALR